MPVKLPAVPVLAATLVLLRDRSSGTRERRANTSERCVNTPEPFEILLIKRHSASRFAAGDYVFPGGTVEAHDAPADAGHFCAGVSADDATRALGVDSTMALAHWVGVIRETFEEVGILLAIDAGGRPARLEPAVLERWRAACHAADAAFFAMLRDERLVLAVDGLVYFAHWITPEESPLRFDTRFFGAVTPPGQEATADGREIVDVRWLAPREALAAATRGEISLRNPTARNIELFAGATSAADALDRLRGREIPAIRPRVITENGARRILMPGDEGYW